MGKTALKLFLGALALRLLYVLFFPHLPVGGDALDYEKLALNLLAGNGYSLVPGIPAVTRPPLFPFLLAAVFGLFGQVYTAVFLLQALLSAATCALVYLLGREFLDEPAARLGGWLCAFYPPLIGYTGLLLTETFFTFLLAAVFLLLARALATGKAALYAACGLLLGAATLCRPTTLLFPWLMLAAALAWDLPAWKRTLPRWLLLAACFAAAVGPWTWRNYHHYGSPLLVNTGGSLTWRWTAHMAAGGTFQEGVDLVYVEMQKFSEPEKFVRGVPHPRMVLDARLSKEAKDLIRANFGSYLQIVIKRLPGFWITSHSAIFGVDKSLSEYRAAGNYGPVVFRLGLLGLQAALVFCGLAGIYLCRRDWRRQLALLLTLFYFTGHIAFDPAPRYHVPVMPYVLLFCAAALLKFREFAKR
ncbi:MAG: glycosyltransferase family 39 protein [Elusimicrobiales bacterium]|nr:glycosyltransferase family 39 protein [Elusimicrobiales bacterium]